MLDKDATEKLNSVMPEITGQTQTMENVEERVETARTKLAQQVDMVPPDPPPESQNTWDRVDCSWRILISKLLKIGG